MRNTGKEKHKGAMFTISSIEIMYHQRGQRKPLAPLSDDWQDGLILWTDKIEWLLEGE